MTQTASAIRHIVGVMTGTSIDGIDAALVKVTGAGLHMQATLVRHTSGSLGELRTLLRDAADQKEMSAGEFARISLDFGELHANVVCELLGQSRADLICAHGQTVFHQPPVSWQLINPSPIAERCKCPVVFDLRQADLAAGGQGAPITPLADWILFRDERHSRAVINLGGFCNITILPRRAAASSPAAAPNLTGIRGFDVCACNQILDEIARVALGSSFDEDGRAAGNGSAQPHAAAELREVLEQQRTGGRSLGTGDESAAWIVQHASNLTGDDLAATAVAAIAQSTAAAIKGHSVDELILAGGGARNRTLAASISKACGMPCVMSDELGVPIEAREAMCFAVLGALCADGVPITLPAVTGCTSPAPISGCWTFSRDSARTMRPSAPDRNR